MERSYLLLLGALSGLVSVLFHAVLWSLFNVVRPHTDASAAAGRLDFPDIVLHVVSGTGLGLFFWMSWGLAAMIDVAWWIRGMAFGGLAWMFVAVPAIISLARTRAAAAGATSVVALQWATTCLIAGLACAWSWQRAM